MQAGCAVQCSISTSCLVCRCEYTCRPTERSSAALALLHFLRGDLSLVKSKGSLQAACRRDEPAWELASKIIGDLLLSGFSSWLCLQQSYLEDQSLLVTVVRAEDSKMFGKYGFWRTQFGIILVHRPWEA